MRSDTFNKTNKTQPHGKAGAVSFRAVLWTLIKARLRMARNSAFKRGDTRLIGTFVKALTAAGYLALFASLLRAFFAAYSNPRLAAAAAFAAAGLLMTARAVQYALAQTPGKGVMRILEPLPVSGAKICAARIVDGAFDSGIFIFLSAGPAALGYALAFPPNPFQALVFLLGWTALWVSCASIGTAANLLFEHFAAKVGGGLRWALGIPFVSVSSIAFFFTLLLPAVDASSESLDIFIRAEPLLRWSPSIWLADALINTAPVPQAAGCIALASALTASTFLLHALTGDAEAALVETQTRPLRRKTRLRPRTVLVSLIMKDLKLSVRNSGLLTSWTLPFLLLIAIKAFRNWASPETEPSVGASIGPMAILGSIVVGLVIVSLDGRAYLMLRSILPRFGLYAAAKTLIASGAIFAASLGSFAVEAHTVPSVEWMLTAAGIAVGSGGFSVGIGCLMPRFEEENPMRAAHMLSILIVLFHAIVTIVCLESLSPVWTAAVSCALGLFIAAIGARRLERMDVTL